MKPSKKLMRDFAKAIDPDAKSWSALMDLETVIELALKWCDKHGIDFYMIKYASAKSDTTIALYAGKNKLSAEYGDISTAIMRAVVNAAKSEG